MALIFMPRKSALILLLILGTICLVDGIPKKDVKEILVAVAILTYVIVSFITGRKKNPANKNYPEQRNPVKPNR